MDSDRRNANIDNMLANAHQTVIETQDVGRGILTELDAQRQQLLSMHDKITSVNHNLSRSHSILTRIGSFSIKERLLGCGIIIVCLLIIILIVILSVR
jgi:vesicle transport through interaction with t-SNAREs protein 1